ncbi:hypothetical protein KU306_02480 [Haloferax larsenii]|uniref:Uncharacterized protein n=1 Tax=Haloferax larsenii TaxID=302484 RepID=A0ABY5REK6_HALLR|nr:hypothetical protein [Haloferax larsenii]UVE50776.1 hypothetical protein KU306_02480 [Haloferax larsenii]
MSDEADDGRDDKEDDSFRQPTQDLDSAIKTLSQINTNTRKLYEAIDKYQEIDRKLTQVFSSLDFSNLEQAAAISINPKLFRQVESLNQTAVLDMYKVVAATRDVEAATAEEEDLEDGDLEVADNVEATYYDLLATYVSNYSGNISSGVRSAADSILSSDKIQEKRDSVAELFHRADEQTIEMLVSVTWMCIQIIVVLMLGRVGSEDSR